MPVVLRYQGFKFFFYSNEGNPREPAHVHVRSAEGEAKFWLNPEVALARNDGYSARALKESLLSFTRINPSWKGLGMTISPKAVRFDDCTMWVELSDGRTIGVPLVWFPRLLSASQEQREQFELSARGIHWDALDEDISVDGLLAGRGDTTHSPSKAA